MLQLRVRCLRNEALGQQALQLTGDVVGHVLGWFGVFQLARGSRIFNQNGTHQARHFLSDQVQAGASFFHACLEAGGIGGQRVGQVGAVQRHGNDLVAQFIGGPQTHVGHGHLLQIGNVLFQILERLLDLQSHQTAQAGTVFGGGHVGLVKDVDLDVSTLVDQRWEAHQRVAATLDLHQLGQFTKGPIGEGLGSLRLGGCTTGRPA